MAALGSTNVSTAIAPGGVVPIQTMGEDGLILEVWRIPGGTAGDTCTIVPHFITDVRSVLNPANFGNALSASQANTQVVLTAGTGINTSLTYDVHIYGRRQS